MADITVTAASVLASASTGVLAIGTAGASLTAGLPLYKDATDSNKLKSCISSSAAAANCVGIALHAAASGQPIEYITAGDLNPGGTVVVGRIYCVSANAGGIAPQSDLSAGQFVTILGIGTTTSNISLGIKAGGIAYA